MMENVSIRLEKGLMREAGKLAKLTAVDKSTIIREALDKGLAGVKLRIAVELFANGEASTSEAAEISSLSVGDFMDALVKRGIKPAIKPEDFEGSLETALRLVK